MVLSANNHSLLNVDDIPAAERYFVAFSGGIDSTALLYAVCQHPVLKNKLTAIHINHNLQTEAENWVQHCEHVCRDFNVPLIVESVQLTSSSEEACRQARLACYNKHLSVSDCLLIAHHADDQAETMLFRLFRGTGLNGLLGISQQQKMEHYLIYRPLLHLKKSDLSTYVSQHGLKHINDPSNEENHYSRNLIRNQLMPLIQTYQPNLVNNLNQTANHLRHSEQLIRKLIKSENPLHIDSFNDAELLATAIYHWLHQLVHHNASHKQLKQYAHDCLSARAGKQPQLNLASCVLWSWQQKLYALHVIDKFDQTPQKLLLKSNQKQEIANGFLLFSSPKLKSLDITIKYQQGFETLKTNPKRPNKTIKKLFQEQQTPPWIRQCIPYLYVNDCLVAVGDYFIENDFQKFLAKNKAQIEWLSPEFLL